MTTTPNHSADRRNDMPVLLLTMLAGPYRIFAFHLHSFGGKDTGAITWFGILLLFPLWTSSSSSGAVWLWLLLIACAWVKMFVKWCSQKPALDPCVPHCWMGQGEPALAFFLYIVMAAACDDLAAGMYFVMGYVCSMAEWRLQRRWRDERNGQLPQRRTAPVVGPMLARLAAGGVRALQYVWSFLIRRRQAASAGQGPYVPPPSFGRRVLSTITGHLILSTISGFIGFNVLGLILALPLWLMGWRLDMPNHMKQEVKNTVSRIKEALADEKDELMERLHDKSEALQQRFDQRLEEEKRRLREEFSRRAQQQPRRYVPYRSFGERNP